MIEVEFCLKFKECRVGKLRIENCILTLDITCLGQEVTAEDIQEIKQQISILSQSSLPFLVNASKSHSVSFEAVREMSNSKAITALAIYAPDAETQIGANFIEDFHSKSRNTSYPVKVFSDLDTAKKWLARM